jgi:hypothetical protein
MPWSSLASLNAGSMTSCCGSCPLSSKVALKIRAHLLCKHVWISDKLLKQYGGAEIGVPMRETRYMQANEKLTSELQGASTSTRSNIIPQQPPANFILSPRCPPQASKELIKTLPSREFRQGLRRCEGRYSLGCRLSVFVVKGRHHTT